MRLDQVSDMDLVDLHRLSKELLSVMYRVRMHDAILADLLEELEQATANTHRARGANSAENGLSSGRTPSRSV